MNLNERILYLVVKHSQITSIKKRQLGRKTKFHVIYSLYAI